MERQHRMQNLRKSAVKILNDKPEMCSTPHFHLRRIGPRATKVGVANIMDFSKTTTLIGRNKTQVDYLLDSSNPVASQYISRLHARVILQENHQCRLFNDSLNGIFINNTKMCGSIILQEGDIVTFGHPYGAQLATGVWKRQPDSEYQFIFEQCTCQPPPKKKKTHVLEDKANISQTGCSSVPAYDNAKDMETVLNASKILDHCINKISGLAGSLGYSPKQASTSLPNCSLNMSLPSDKNLPKKEQVLESHPEEENVGQRRITDFFPSPACVDSSGNSMKCTGLEDTFVTDSPLSSSSLPQQIGSLTTEDIKVPSHAGENSVMQNKPPGKTDYTRIKIHLAPEAGVARREFTNVEENFPRRSASQELFPQSVESNKTCISKLLSDKDTQSDSKQLCDVPTQTVFVQMQKETPTKVFHQEAVAADVLNDSGKRLKDAAIRSQEEANSCVPGGQILGDTEDPIKKEVSVQVSLGQTTSTHLISKQMSSCNKKVPCISKETGCSIEQVPRISESMTNSNNQTPNVSKENVHNSDQVPRMSKENASSKDQVPCVLRENADSNNQGPHVSEKNGNRNDPEPCVLEENANSNNQTPYVLKENAKNNNEASHVSEENAMSINQGPNGSEQNANSSNQVPCIFEETANSNNQMPYKSKENVNNNQVSFVSEENSNSSIQAPHVSEENTNSSDGVPANCNNQVPHVSKENTISINQGPHALEENANSNNQGLHLLEENANSNDQVLCVSEETANSSNQVSCESRENDNSTNQAPHVSKENANSNDQLSYASEENANSNSQSALISEKNANSNNQVPHKSEEKANSNGQVSCVSAENANSNSEALAISEENDQVPHVTEENDQVPHVSEENDQVPCVTKENANSNSEAPAISEENEQVPHVSEENNQVPQASVQNDQVPHVSEENNQVPQASVQNDQVPHVSEENVNINNQEPLVSEQNVDSNNQVADVSKDYANSNNKVAHVSEENANWNKQVLCALEVGNSNNHLPHAFEKLPNSNKQVPMRMLNLSKETTNSDEEFVDVSKGTPSTCEQTITESKEAVNVHENELEVSEQMTEADEQVPKSESQISTKEVRAACSHDPKQCESQGRRTCGTDLYTAVLPEKIASTSTWVSGVQERKETLSRSSLCQAQTSPPVSQPAVTLEDIGIMTSRQPLVSREAGCQEGPKEVKTITKPQRLQELLPLFSSETLRNLNSLIKLTREENSKTAQREYKMLSKALYRHNYGEAQINLTPNPDQVDLLAETMEIVKSSYAMHSDIGQNQTFSFLNKDCQQKVVKTQLKIFSFETQSSLEKLIYENEDQRLRDNETEHQNFVKQWHSARLNQSHTGCLSHCSEDADIADVVKLGYNLVLTNTVDSPITETEEKTGEKAYKEQEQEEMAGPAVTEKLKYEHLKIFNSETKSNLERSILACRDKKLKDVEREHRQFVEQWHWINKSHPELLLKDPGHTEMVGVVNSSYSIVSSGTGGQLENQEQRSCKALSKQKQEEEATAEKNLVLPEIADDTSMCINVSSIPGIANHDSVLNEGQTISADGADKPMLDSQSEPSDSDSDCQITMAEYSTDNDCQITTAEHSTDNDCQITTAEHSTDNDCRITRVEHSTDNDCQITMAEHITDNDCQITRVGHGYNKGNQITVEGQGTAITQNEMASVHADSNTDMEVDHDAKIFSHTKQMDVEFEPDCEPADSQFTTSTPVVDGTDVTPCILVSPVLSGSSMSSQESYSATSQGQEDTNSLNTLRRNLCCTHADKNPKVEETDFTGEDITIVASDADVNDTLDKTSTLGATDRSISCDDTGVSTSIHQTFLDGGIDSIHSVEVGNEPTLNAEELEALHRHFSGLQKEQTLSAKDYDGELAVYSPNSNQQTVFANESGDQCEDISVVEHEHTKQVELNSVQHDMPDMKQQQQHEMVTILQPSLTPNNDKTQNNLMKRLEIVDVTQVAEKEIPDAPHQELLSANYAHGITSASGSMPASVSIERGLVPGASQQMVEETVNDADFPCDSAPITGVESKHSSTEEFGNPVEHSTLFGPVEFHAVISDQQTVVKSCRFDNSEIPTGNSYHVRKHPTEDMTINTCSSNMDSSDHPKTVKCGLFHQMSFVKHGAEHGENSASAGINGCNTINHTPTEAHSQVVSLPVETSSCQGVSSTHSSSTSSESICLSQISGFRDENDMHLVWSQADISISESSTASDHQETMFFEDFDRVSLNPEDQYEVLQGTAKSKIETVSTDEKFQETSANKDSNILSDVAETNIKASIDNNLEVKSRVETFNNSGTAEDDQKYGGGDFDSAYSLRDVKEGASGLTEAANDINEARHNSDYEVKHAIASENEPESMKNTQQDCREILHAASSVSNSCDKVSCREGHKEDVVGNGMVCTTGTAEDVSGRIPSTAGAVVSFSSEVLTPRFATKSVSNGMSSIARATDISGEISSRPGSTEDITCRMLSTPQATYDISDGVSVTDRASASENISCEISNTAGALEDVTLVSSSFSVSSDAANVTREVSQTTCVTDNISDPLSSVSNAAEHVGSGMSSMASDTLNVSCTSSSTDDTTEDESSKISDTENTIQCDTKDVSNALNGEQDESVTSDTEASVCTVDDINGLVPDSADASNISDDVNRSRELSRLFRETVNKANSAGDCGMTAVTGTANDNCLDETNITDHYKSVKSLQKTNTTENCFKEASVKASIAEGSFEKTSSSATQHNEGCLEKVEETNCGQSSIQNEKSSLKRKSIEEPICSATKKGRQTYSSHAGLLIPQDFTRLHHETKMPGVKNEPIGYSESKVLRPHLCPPQPKSNFTPNSSSSSCNLTADSITCQAHLGENTSHCLLSRTNPSHSGEESLIQDLKSLPFKSVAESSEQLNLFASSSNSHQHSTNKNRFPHTDSGETGKTLSRSQKIQASTSTSLAVDNLARDEVEMEPSINNDANLIKTRQVKILHLVSPVKKTLSSNYPGRSDSSANISHVLPLLSGPSTFSQPGIHLPTSSSEEEDYTEDRKDTSRRESLQFVVLAELEKLTTEIRTSLRVDSPRVPQAISALEDLEQLPVTPTLLIKKPILLDTVKKCQRYGGSSRVRELSQIIYTRYKALILHMRSSSNL